MVRHTMIVLAGTLVMGMTSGVLADDAKAPLGSEQNLGGAPKADNAVMSGRSSTRDTSIGRDEKLNIGPGAKSGPPLPPKRPSDQMSSPD